MGAGDGAEQVGQVRLVERRGEVLRPAGRRYRYYLVWSTALPAGASAAKIGEVRLFRRTG